MNSLTTALINIRRSPYQSLAAILLLSLTFFVGYALAMFAIGSEMVLRYFETRPQVIAFFELDAPATDINQLAKDMQQQSYVTQVKIVSQEDALKIYQEENKYDPLLLELVTSQILPASIEVSGDTIDDLDKIKEVLEAEDIVEEVVLQQDIVDSLAAWTTSIRIGGLGSVGILATTSLLMMMIVIGMKVVTRRPAINIMRIIGARRWYIRSPFVLEGVIYGLVSSALGFTVMVGGLLYITPWLHDFLGPIQLLPAPLELYAVLLATGSLVGMVLGALAGSLAVGRIMRK